MKQLFGGRTKEGILAELNVYRQALGKTPVKRWRKTREELEEVCQRLLDKVEEKRKQEQRKRK